jgi:tripartite-type tricarboxylate transporter receptor subunit TctC
VPYRGDAPAVQDLAAGQIDVVLAPPVFLPLARSENIKVYAVTSDMRMTLVAPDIPTFTERDFRRVRTMLKRKEPVRGARRGISLASSTR